MADTPTSKSLRIVRRAPFDVHKTRVYLLATKLRDSHNLELSKLAYRFASLNGCMGVRIFSRRDNSGFSRGSQPW